MIVPIYKRRLIRAAVMMLCIVAATSIAVGVVGNDKNKPLRYAISQFSIVQDKKTVPLKQLKMLRYVLTSREFISGAASDFGIPLADVAASVKLVGIDKYNAFRVLVYLDDKAKAEAICSKLVQNAKDYLALTAPAQTMSLYERTHYVIGKPDKPWYSRYILGAEAGLALGLALLAFIWCMLDEFRSTAEAERMTGLPVLAAAWRGRGARLGALQDSVDSLAEELAVSWAERLRGADPAGIEVCFVPASEAVRRDMPELIAEKLAQRGWRTALVTKTASEHSEKPAEEQAKKTGGKPGNEKPRGNPVLLPISERMDGSFLRDIQSRFEFVIIDVPEQAAESVCVASADVLFLQIRMCATSTKQARGAIDRIHSMGGRLCGCVAEQTLLSRLFDYGLPAFFHDLLRRPEKRHA